MTAEELLAQIDAERNDATVGDAHRAAAKVLHHTWLRSREWAIAAYVNEQQGTVLDALTAYLYEKDNEL